MSQKGKTRSDEPLIAALVAGLSIAASAREAGMSTRTAQRRMADQEFQKKFAEAKARLVRETTVRLTANSGRAVDVLKKIFTDKKATSAARVTAAVNTIRLTLEAHEIESLEQRITALERQKDAPL
jgi:hypothetical protein